MPPGSKKRKASKKPKPGELPTTPRGDVPQLDSTSLGESMEKDGEEMVEGSLSPKAMEEAKVEEGVEECTELSREASQEGVESEETSQPGPNKVSLMDPSSQPESGTEIPRAKTPDAENEASIDIPAEGEPTPQIKGEVSTSVPIEPESDALLSEKKTETEADTAHAEPAHDADNIDENEPKEEAPIEIGLELRGGPGESEPGTNEIHVEVEQTTAVADEEGELENDKTLGVIPLEVEPQVDYAPVEMNPVMDEAQADTQPENNEGRVVLDTDAASTTIEREGTDDTTAGTAADTNEGPTNAQLKMDEALVKRQVEMDAVPGNLEVDLGLDATPVDAQHEIDEALVGGDLDLDVPSTDIEPAVPADIDRASMDGTSVETAAETDEATGNGQLEREEATMLRHPETDAVTPETSAATVDSDFEKGTAIAERDPSVNKVLQDFEQVDARTKSQTDASEDKIEVEPETDVFSAEVEPEMETILQEAELETESSLHDIKPAVDADVNGLENNEVAQPESKLEVEAAQADIEPGKEERDSAVVEPEFQVENIYVPVETEAYALKDIEPEAESPEDASMEPQARTGPTAHEAGEWVERAEPLKGSEEDGDQGIETPLEADFEPEGGTVPVNEFEAETVGPKLETGVVDVSEFEADRQGSTETESDQKDFGEIVPDQSDANVYNQQVQDQDRGTKSVIESRDLLAAEAVELGIEAAELPEAEIDQVDFGAVSAGDDTDSVDAAVSFLPDGETAAILGTGVPAIEHENAEMQEEGEAVPGSGESKDEIVDEQGQAMVEINFDEDKASSGELNTTVVPCKQELGTQPASAATFEGEVSRKEEPFKKEPVTKLEYVTMDPFFVDDALSGEPEMVEGGLQISLPSQSEMPDSECEFKNGVALGQEENYTSSGDGERDVGEEEVVSSTVAEAGSVLNDLDDSASYQQLPTDFSSDQDADISEGREYDDTSFLKAPEPIETGSLEPLGSEYKKGDNTSSKVLADDTIDYEKSAGVYNHGGDKVVSPVAVGGGTIDEVEWKNVQDLEFSSKHEQVSPVSAKANDPVTSPLEVVTSPADVHLSEVVDAADKEVSIMEEDGNQNRQGAAPSTFGIVPALDFLSVAEEELMAKVAPSEVDGQSSLPGSEATTQDVFVPVERTGIANNTVVITDEPEICTVEAEDLNAGTSIPSEREFENNYYDGTPLQSASPGRDIRDVQAFHQQNTQEASLPVVVPAQDVKQKALEKVNSNGNDRSSEITTLQRRTKGFNCCGLFDVILGKNK